MHINSSKIVLAKNDCTVPKHLLKVMIYHTFRNVYAGKAKQMLTQTFQLKLVY